MGYECWDINGHSLEFFEDNHMYLYDCYLTLPSITECLKMKFGNKYAAVDGATLQRAAERGTAIHAAVENHCKGKTTEIPEIRNFKFLQKHYKFEVCENEVPVILYLEDEPILAGRLDMVMRMDEHLGIGDIKTTSTLDKEYLAYQLNLYRIAYQQCYGAQIEFLKGIHLREDKRKFVDIPIREELVLEYVKEWRDKECHE